MEGGGGPSCRKSALIRGIFEMEAEDEGEEQSGGVDRFAPLDVDQNVLFKYPPQHYFPLFFSIKFPKIMPLRYYDLLGVPPNAYQSDIKNAFREMALKYHPDRNAKGQERFSEISKAYSILGDPIKREFYDRYGEGELNKFCADELADELRNRKEGEREEKKKKRMEKEMRAREKEKRKIREAIEKKVKMRIELYEKGEELCKNGNKMMASGIALVSIGTALGIITAAASITLLPVAACAYAIPGVVGACMGVNERKGGRKLMAKNGREMAPAKEHKIG